MKRQARALIKFTRSVTSFKTIFKYSGKQGWPKEVDIVRIGPALADAGPNARPKPGAPLNSDFMTAPCSVNRVTIVVERKYAVQN